MWGNGDYIAGIKLYIKIVDMRQGKSRQLSVHLLGCTLIARGSGVGKKQMQIFLKFVDIVNILLQYSRWWHSSGYY